MFTRQKQQTNIKLHIKDIISINIVNHHVKRIGEILENECAAINYVYDVKETSGL